MDTVVNFSGENFNSTLKELPFVTILEISFIFSKLSYFVFVCHGMSTMIVLDFVLAMRLTEASIIVFGRTEDKVGGI